MLERRVRCKGVAGEREGEDHRRGEEGGVWKGKEGVVRKEIGGEWRN